MSLMNRVSGLVLAAGVAAAGLQAVAQSKPQNYKGLEVSVSGVERASNVSLTDCPPGANIVRGVIKPGTLPKPVAEDAAGKTYNTAQSFAEVGATPSFSCTFSFRVPTGTELKKLTLDTVSIDLPATAK